MKQFKTIIYKRNSKTGGRLEFLLLFALISIKSVTVNDATTTKHVCTVTPRRCWSTYIRIWMFCFQGLSLDDLASSFVLILNVVVKSLSNGFFFVVENRKVKVRTVSLIFYLCCRQVLIWMNNTWKEEKNSFVLSSAKTFDFL